MQVVCLMSPSRLAFYCHKNLHLPKCLERAPSVAHISFWIYCCIGLKIIYWLKSNQHQSSRHLIKLFVQKIEKNCCSCSRARLKNLENTSLMPDTTGQLPIMLHHFEGWWMLFCILWWLFSYWTYLSGKNFFEFFCGVNNDSDWRSYKQTFEWWRN